MAFNLTPSANKGKLKMESFLSDDVQLTRGEVNIADLVAWENQPFKLYSEEKMQEMMKSIEANGLITPITVRPFGEGKYQILAGHNRAEACRRLEMTTIPATIMNVNDHQAKLVVVDTNLCQRIELLPSERAFAYKMQCEALVALGHCKSTNEVAERYGENRRTVQRYLACTRLCSSLMEMLDNGKLILRAAVLLAGMDEQNQCVVGNFLAENEEIRLTEQQAQEIYRTSFRHPISFADMEEVLESVAAPPAKKSSSATETSEREDDTPTEQEETAEDTVTTEPKTEQTEEMTETLPKATAPRSTSNSNISLARNEVTEIIGEDYSNDDILDFIIFCLQHEEWLKEWQEFEKAADEEMDRQA